MSFQKLHKSTLGSCLESYQTLYACSMGTMKENMGLLVARMLQTLVYNKLTCGEGGGRGVQDGEHM